MNMEASIGVNLRVTAHSSQGGRKYMEDMFCVAYQPTADGKDLLYAYFGIFDGHGGKEAALYAKQHLMDHIVSQKEFWSDDDQLVLKAIKTGFIRTHQAMWKDLENWPRTSSGLPSTSGTTASIGFVRRGKMYIGHVGDSGIVLGYQDPAQGYWRAKPLTKDHKPDCEVEGLRITESGGKVVNKSGVPRVVWNRPRVGHKGPVRRSTLVDEIPFLAVARSLGDLWSYNSELDLFVVSPEPDVSVVEIDVNAHRCFILGSDGLWNMMNPQDAVNSVYFAEKNNERQLLASPPDTMSTQVKNWINPSKRLVDRALERWEHHSLRADNTSVVTVVIDPPGPPKAQVLRQTLQKGYVIKHPNSKEATAGKSPTASPSSSNDSFTSSSDEDTPAGQSKASANSNPQSGFEDAITNGGLKKPRAKSRALSGPGVAYNFDRISGTEVALEHRPSFLRRLNDAPIFPSISDSTARSTRPIAPNQKLSNILETRMKRLRENLSLSDDPELEMDVQRWLSEGDSHTTQQTRSKSTRIARASSISTTAVPRRKRRSSDLTPVNPDLDIDFQIQRLLNQAESHSTQLRSTRTRKATDPNPLSVNLLDGFIESPGSTKTPAATKRRSQQVESPLQPSPAATTDSTPASSPELSIIEDRESTTRTMIPRRAKRASMIARPSMIARRGQLTTGRRKVKPAATKNPPATTKRRLQPVESPRQPFPATIAASTSGSGGPELSTIEDRESTTRAMIPRRAKRANMIARPSMIARRGQLTTGRRKVKPAATKNPPVTAKRRLQPVESPRQPFPAAIADSAPASSPELSTIEDPGLTTRATIPRRAKGKSRVAAYAASDTWLTEQWQAEGRRKPVRRPEATKTTSISRRATKSTTRRTSEDLILSTKKQTASRKNPRHH